MRLFLQINIADWKKVAYAKPLLSFASSLSDDLIGTDFDHDSDAPVSDIVRRLIDQADKIFLVVIPHQPELPLGSSLSVLNHLIKEKNKVHQALLTGDHPLAEKMLRLFGELFTKEENEEAIKKRIVQFARQPQNTN